MWCVITKLSQCLAFAGAVELFFQLTDLVVALFHPNSNVDDVLLDFLELFRVVVSILEIKLILIVLLLVVLKHVQLLAECPVFGQDLIYPEQGWHIHEADFVELAEDPGSRLRLPCSLKVEHLQPGQLLSKAHKCISCI
jgi:hypothetical protein